MTENNIEIDKQEWPFWWKASAVYGAGLVVGEAAYIWAQAVDKLDADKLYNTAGAAFALAGVWRIVEPFSLSKIKNSEANID